MRSCCDIFPSNFTYLQRRTPWRARGEHGDIDWERVPIRNGSIVYVPSLDIPAFLRRFAELPEDARITVVSGQEDIGVPRELFRLGLRRDQSVPMPLSIEAFVLDPRLLHWWVQNFDLLGCNPYSGCSKLRREAPLARKVSPIPLGLDLHTFAEKLPPSQRVPACAQQAELEAIRNSLPPFGRRPDRILAPFGCRKDRLDACAALRIKPNGAPAVADFFKGPRAQMWRAMGEHAFVAAPRGHGIDTHRLWEVLALGSVPVAIASTLDELYADYPVVTIGAWSDVNASAMALWRAQIRRRFGPNPFDQRMRDSLTVRHWAARIVARHQAELGPGAGDYLGAGWLDKQLLLRVAS
jgi:hypothetical protein